MSEEPLNYNSLMGVLKATVQDKDGVHIPGKFMPSGKPIVAKGVTMEQLASNREMVESWFNAVKVQYEREEEEGNQPSGKSDAPRVDTDGADTPAPVHERVQSTAQAAGTSVEEELQSRLEGATGALKHLDAELERLNKNRADCAEEVMKLQAALKAVTAESNQSSSNDGQTVSTKSGRSTQKPKQ